MRQSNIGFLFFEYYLSAFTLRFNDMRLNHVYLMLDVKKNVAESSDNNDDDHTKLKTKRQL